jgi:hypothetical protein
MMSRELWPILDRHTDHIALGNGFDALVPIPAHDIRTHRLGAVVNHHHRVSTQFTDRPVLGSELLCCVVHGLRILSLTQESMQHEQIVEQNLQRELRTHTC